MHTYAARYAAFPSGNTLSFDSQVAVRQLVVLQQVSTIPSNKENMLVMSTVIQLPVSYNPILLAAAMEKVEIMNTNGWKEDFYYDNEAKQLVKDNGWVKAVIENGKLH
ncbi:hypothetical protein BKA83DRAFT_4121095 [Pisolithus microcarpus]|nr:hypothetical protein BKA83DRAFT_4121095 [Pisolithus microcarpus]